MVVKTKSFSDWSIVVLLLLSDDHTRQTTDTPGLKPFTNDKQHYTKTHRCTSACKSTSKLKFTSTSYFMKHSIAHRGSIVWNAMSVHYDDDNIQNVKTYCKIAKKVDRMDFNALSVQSIPNFKEDFMFY